MIAKLVELLMPAAKPTWSSDDESKFKYLLTRVKVKAFNYEGGIAVRPENVGKFKELCDKEGIGQLDEVVKTIQYLNKWPGEYIRFEW